MTILNNYKTKLSKLEEQLSKPITGYSNDEQNNAQSFVKSSIQSGTYKGKAYLWNEKGFSALSKAIDAFILEGSLDISGSFASLGVGKTVVHSGILEGRFEPEETVLRYLVKGSNIENFILAESPFISICFTEKIIDGEYYGLTAFAFSKNQ